ncbi:MAG: TolC family protein [Acidobacteriota bacterium]|nr:TolC family protein [Acidobacteriota bacterium]
MKIVRLSMLLVALSIGAQAQPAAPVAETISVSASELPVAEKTAAALNPPAATTALPPVNRVGVDVAEQRPLTLREVIALALKNAKDIEVARENVRVAEFDLKGAQGVYDPRFVTSTFFERVETPTASFLGGSASGAVTQAGLVGSARFEGLSPKGGGNYRFEFSSARQTTDSLFASLNPQFPASFNFTYTQPLLRGRNFDQSRRVIEIAKKNLALTDAQFRQRAIETITNVQRAYWDLAFALRNLQVQRDTVRDARAQLEHNKRLVAEGVLAPIDVVAAEAQVAGFEQGVYAALDEVGRAENALKNVIAENREADIWNVSLVPIDAPDTAASLPSVSLPAAMETALKSRPELQQSDVARAINEIEARFAREQTRPQVDLVATYGATGLAGTLNSDGTLNPFTASNEQLRARINELSRINNLPPLVAPPAQVLPDTLIGGYGQSLANLAANRFNTVRVGVTLNLPLRNQTAKAQLGRTLVEGERIKTQREQLEQLIQVEVRNALQATQTAEARLRAATAQRTASEQQYASEQRKFAAGQSTFFLVLERQTALANARAGELRAQTDLNKSIAELNRATGNALEAQQVQVSAR